MSKRQAVGMVLTRNPKSNEVYLVERNPKLRFFGGYFAFPGGTIDDGDDEVPIENAGDIPSDNLAYLAAAAREIFEETGVFTGHGRTIPAAQLALYRKSLLAEESTFIEIMQRERQTLDSKDFQLMAALLTPEFAPVRYDTQFYCVRIPEGQQPEILTGELVSGDFHGANEAMEKWRAGEMSIAPPVMFMLREMENRSLAQAIPVIKAKAEAYRRGAIHEIYFTPGVQMLPLRTRTLPPATHTNAYLVGEHELFLIDPAPAESAEQQRLWNYLDDRLAEGRQLKGILLTHHHSDHVGAVHECQRRYDLPIFAHAQTIKRLPRQRSSETLQNGDELDLGMAPDGTSNWKLKVSHTPGHAPGHLVFQESRYGAVIAGDLISTLSTIIISPPEGHLATYMDSLTRMMSICDGTIYPGHGPAVKTGKKVLKQFIRHREERESKLLAALAEHPQSISELVPIVYDDVNPALWGLAKHSLEAGLIKLMEEERCREEAGGYSLRN